MHDGIIYLLALNTFYWTFGKCFYYFLVVYLVLKLLIIIKLRIPIEEDFLILEIIQTLQVMVVVQQGDEVNPKRLNSFKNT